MTPLAFNILIHEYRSYADGKDPVLLVNFNAPPLMFWKGGGEELGSNDWLLKHSVVSVYIKYIRLSTNVSFHFTST